MEKEIKEMTMWLTYHDDAQLQQYNLTEDETVRLFKGNDMTVEGEHINYLNSFYSEMTTMYWVWKNYHKSIYVGFCHYRRRFTHMMELDKNECQVMEVINFPFSVFQHYKNAHNYNDYYDMIDVQNDKYGKGNPYTEYLLHSKVFIPFCSFIMKWEDFESLCSFLFSILLELDRRQRLEMSVDKYWEKAERDFRYDDKKYQARAMSFLAERLISCYIVCHMNVLCVKAVETKLGYYD